MVFLAFITHILLDGLTVHGTQILWPLVRPPVMWSTIFIINPADSIPLIFGVAAAIAMPRTTQAGHVINRVCLILTSLYLVWTIGVKAHVGNVARDHLASMSGHLVWEYPFWERSFQRVWFIFIIGYFHFLCAAIFVITRKAMNAKLITLVVIYAVPILINILGLGVFKWNY